MSDNQIYEPTAEEVRELVSLCGQLCIPNLNYRTAQDIADLMRDQAERRLERDRKRIFEDQENNA